MTRRVLRWPIMVNDQPQQIGGGQVLLTAVRRSGAVEVWTLEVVEAGDQPTAPPRTVQVFGTGQPLPDTAVDHIGSALDGKLVWHVFQVTT